MTCSWHYADLGDEDEVIQDRHVFECRRAPVCAGPAPGHWTVRLAMTQLPGVPLESSTSSRAACACPGRPFAPRMTSCQPAGSPGSCWSS
ncbi:unnamed protein product [Prorocentrum cordatum]|uniref:Beta-galactosidase n=1 Tax=Prorocentrum cordatum TaxID=2364126 RepID=A0ABN9QLX9_9DINO|nr:unnamed protein product [Polarella glacialis]